jgi:hypothetical protein
VYLQFTAGNTAISSNAREVAVSDMIVITSLCDDGSSYIRTSLNGEPAGCSTSCRSCAMITDAEEKIQLAGVDTKNITTTSIILYIIWIAKLNWSNL